MSKRPALLAGLLCGLALWLAGAGAPSGAAAEEATLVRGMKSLAVKQQIYLDVHGQTRANRVVRVRSEVAGKIVELPGEKGMRVQAGDLLCRIATDSRSEDHAQAQARVQSAQLEYDGMADLSRRGLQSDVLLAKAKAVLEESRAQARRAQLALEKTALQAPFDGLVEKQFVEEGDYLVPGDPCVTLMEIDPMLLAGQIAEKNIGRVALGGKVEARLITGETRYGEVTYIGHAPDAATRTYPIEVTVENPSAEIRVGLTAEMRVPLGVEEAHLISAASLLLDDLGQVGVHLVDASGRVVFMPVAVVDEGPSGLLVKGLPREITLIIVGHEEVSPGQLVQVDYTPITELVTF